MVGTLCISKCSSNSSIDSSAIKLAKKLDGLPLALATAGAYLDQAAISVSAYLRLYEKSWAKLQKTSPELSSYEDRTLYSTWQISFEHVERRNVLSAQLLRLWAYFDNQDLWLELLQHSVSERPDWIRDLVEDELSFYGAMRVLSDHGLVEVDKSSQELLESRGYSIHGCVHLWTVHVLNQEWDYSLAKVALESVALHVPGEQANRPWLTQRRLLQHAARCSYIVLNGLVPDDGMAETYFSLGYLFNDQSKFAEAEKMYHRALRGFEKAWGLDYILTLKTVNNLGNFYTNQGKLDEAEKMYQRALQGFEKVWGLDHRLTLGIANNLGILYINQGKLDEAEKMYQRALQGKEKVWGLDHTSTLDTVNNLSNLYVNQGKLDKAEKMYQWALQGKEKAWGLDHTLTLDTVNNLGILYKFQGKLDKAEKMYQRALQGFEKAWGLDHTSTLDIVNNLGNLYVNQSKLDEAEKMYQRALQGKEKVWGLDHTSTINTVINLGSLYANQGKLDKAEKMYQRALQGKEKAWGLDHILTLDMVNNLGSLYANQGKLDKAGKMYQQTLQGYEKAWGPDYTSTLNTVNNLGNFYKSQDKLDKAEKLYQRALQGYEKAWGSDHTSTLDTVNNLGMLYYDRCYYVVRRSIWRKLHFYPALVPDLSYVPDMVKLVELCIQYPSCRTILLASLCGMFRWNGEDTLSILAFSFAVVDSLPHYNVICDGCQHDLGITTGRFACKSCKNIDLCKSCFGKYELDELEDILESCQDHHFLELSKSSTNGLIATTQSSAEQWLQELLSNLKSQ
jgi:tetratricopeptide (TPR) repeat protein